MPNPSSVNASNFHHLPVLANDVMQSINNLPTKLLDGGLIIDATLGGGGHCAMLLEAHPNIHAIGLDQDSSARKAAQKRLSRFGKRVKIVASNFANFSPQEKAIAVLADLGVSSPQLDIGARGFSFRIDGPLDMRMNQEEGETAAELIEKLNETELANIIYKYGEEKLSRRIARRIKKDLLNQGPYTSTATLAYAVAGCYPPNQRRGRIHPATRTFQALRIAVNNELNVLEQFLGIAPAWLLPGGVLNVISFHSLEDRLVKRAFVNDDRLERMTRKPLVASSSELSRNPRSRSAKLRIALRHPYQ